MYYMRIQIPKGKDIEYSSSLGMCVKYLAEYLISNGAYSGHFILKIKG